MQKISLRVLITLMFLSIFSPLFSQTKTNTEILRRAAVVQTEKEKILYEQLKVLARQKGWDMTIKRPNGGIAILVGIDDLGNPLYTGTDNNIDAAATIGTNTLWTGGSTGLDLNGASNSVKGKLAVWDGGRVRGTHVELTGRVLQKDNPAATSDHSTHVAGTMIASGVNPLAKGMSNGQQQLIAYDFGNDGSEMLFEAPNLLVSNHSYGTVAGWVFNSGQNRWEFNGLVDANEDYKFGYYSDQAQLWDSIAYNAPYYLMVKSSGNKRNENGPAEGQPYWRRNASGVFELQPSRPAGISSNNSYDIIPTYGTAKNILTLGAVNPVPNGYTRPEDVVMSSFSSWGPTDDGRIKPDVVADGVNLLSSTDASDNSYAIFSGTSMSSPNASGSIILLQEYYARLHGNAFMRSATLKGLVIHTADEAGTAAGPDYQNGWGLINVKKAAAVLTANNTTHLVQENVLNNGGTYSIPVVATGNGKLIATICWTDPKADVEPVSNALNNHTKKLVNDLDIRITKGATTFLPWILDPANPSAAATRGDNILDNVEKITIDNVIPGQTYTITISHKGALARGSQAYSLIVSGVGGQAYCTSAASSSTNGRIERVTFGTIDNINPPGCTTYRDFTNISTELQPGQTLPFTIDLNTCGADNWGKMYKVYIDYNSNGLFTDPGELASNYTGIIFHGSFSTDITIPNNVTIGNSAIMRVVMQETSTYSDINPCGNYPTGETQDYRVVFAAPAKDAGVTSVVAPALSYCQAGEQYATVRVRNFGTSAISNVPVSALVKQGATAIINLTGVFAGTIPPGGEIEYTFQNTFPLLANSAYTITAKAELTGDQAPLNDQLISSFTTSPSAAAPTGTAVVCGTTNALLKVTSTGTPSDVFGWYTAATPAITPYPVTTGTNTTTTWVVNPYYLSKNEASAKLGPSNKFVYPQGGYNTFVNNMVRFTASVPVTIETARLYIGHPGKITFLLRQIVTYNETTGAYTYFPVSSKTINVTATAPTPPALGAQVNDPGDAGAIYYLGINIPEPGNYGIVIQCEDGSSIFRNNMINSNPYPYTMPGILSITGNTAILAGNPDYFQQFYYFFYDIGVKLSSCASPRVPIVPTTETAPVITLAGNVFSSTAAVSYQWYRNGSSIPGAIAQTYTATEAGAYKVNAVFAGGCSFMSNEINFVPTAVPNVNPDEIGLIVSPNPATSGQVNVQLKTNTRADLNVALINTSGQKVYQQSVPNFIGRWSQTLQPGKLAPGIYYLQVQHDKKMYVRKVVIVE
jgi:hypothetical protein